MRALFGLVFVVFSVGVAAQDTSYLCMADQATGFRFDKTTKKWSAATFDVSSDKYIVARSKDESYTWVVTKVGDDQPLFYCKDNIGADDQILDCNLFDPSFHFDVRTLRFTAIRVQGYIVPSGHGRNEGDAEPLMEIGTCAPL